MNHILSSKNGKMFLDSKISYITNKSFIENKKFVVVKENFTIALKIKDKKYSAIEIMCKLFGEESRGNNSISKTPKDGSYLPKDAVNLFEYVNNLYNE